MHSFESTFHATSVSDWRPLRRGTLFPLAALGLSSLVAVVIVELSCRMMGFAPVVPSAPPLIDPGDLHATESIREAQLKSWTCPPRIVNTKVCNEHPARRIVIRRNDCGFREDEDIPISKPDGLYRVLVLGDSHTDGVCFNNESYPNRLEQLLSQSHNEPTFEVINAGQCAFSPYQEWWLYEQVGRHFSPNLIVVGFYAGNDYWDLFKDDDRVYLRSNGDAFEHADPAVPRIAADLTTAPQRAKPQVFASSIRSFLRSHSATYNAIVGIAPLRALVIRTEHSAYEAPILQIKPDALGAYTQSLGQDHYFAHHPQDLDQADALWSAVLQRLRDSAQRDGAQLIILLIPSLRDIDSHDLPEVQTAIKTLGLTVPQSRLDSEVADRAMRQANQLGVECIDLRPVFREHMSSMERPRLYYQNDQHLSPAGNAVVAEALAQHLKGILSKPASAR